MAKSVNVSSYMKNLIKSGGYVAVDLFKSYAPTMSILGEKTKDATTTAYKAIKDFVGPENTSSFSFKNLVQSGKDTAKNVWSNMLDDLKTGKLYNKERQDALGSEFAEGLGLNFDLDFDFDDDWGDDEEDFSESDSAKAQVTTEVQTSKAIIASVDAMGKGLASTIVASDAASTNYIVDSARDNTKALFNLNKEGFGTITKSLNTVNETIYAFSKIGEPLTAHMQNSTVFFASTTKSLQNIEQTLKEIEKNTTPVSGAENRRANRKTSLNDLITDEGGIDFSGLLEYTKSSINEYKDSISMITDFIKPIGKSKGKNISPMSSITKSIVDKLIPTLVKESIKDLDESISDALGAGLIKASKKRTGNFLIDTILDLVVPGMNRKTTIDVGNYEKGPVAWDGVARKALIDVIPTTLLEIYSAITGSEPMRFDYRSGKFVKTKSILSEQRARKEEYIKDSGGEFYEDVISAIDKKYKNNKSENSRVQKEALKFFEKAFDTGDFSIFNKTPEYFGIDPATLALIQTVMTDYGNDKNPGEVKRMNNKWSKKAISAAASYSRYIEDEEANGFNPITMLHEKDEFAKNGKGSIFGLDQYGHNYYYYLQGIWQYTKYVADNFDNGFGTSGSGTYTQIKSGDEKYTKIKSIIPKKKKNKDEDQVTNIYKTETERLKEEKEAKDKERKEKLAKSKIGQWAESHDNFFANMIKKIAGIKDQTSEEMAASLGIAHSITKNLDTLIWGTADNPEGGLGNYMINRAKELFDTAKEWFKKNVSDKFKEWASDVWDKFKETKFSEETGKSLKKVGAHLKGKTRDIFFGKQDEDESEDKSKDNGTAAYGRKVTKSGVVIVSEGELIIPSELNPYYKGKTDKKQQIANENRIYKNYLGSFAKGGIAGEGFIMTDPKEEKKKLKVKDNSIFGLLFRGATQAFSSVKSYLDSRFSKEKTAEEEEESKKRADKLKKMVLDAVGDAKGNIGAGALLGFGGAALTGIMGPLAGAAIGAGIGLLTK